MIHKCDNCGGRSKMGLRFRISPIDAIGFVCLLVVSTVPVWLVSFFVAVIVSTPEEGGMEGPLQELITLGFTLMYFFMFGSKLAKFISLFVNFNLQIKSYCKSCNRLFMEKSFPEPMDKLNV